MTAETEPEFLTPAPGKAAAQRGRCLYCGKSKPLTKNGKIRRHWVTADASTLAPGQRVVCGGSGRQA